MEKKIKSLIDEMQTVTEYINQRNESMRGVLMESASLEKFFDKDIIFDYESLKKIPLGTTYQITDGIICWRLPIFKEGYLYFMTQWLKDASTGNHLHNCPEIIYVMTQNVIDLISGASSSSRYHIPAMQTHDILAKAGTLILVGFKEPKQ
ncbi:MAG: hypothetical protein AAFO94_19260 [Bacteroidota bacterium]